MSFSHKQRIEVYSFDTNLSRVELRRFHRKYVPELSISEMLTVTAEAVLGYAKGHDQEWYEDLQDSLDDILTQYYQMTEADLDQLSALTQERAASISDLCQVIQPGLLGILDHANFDYRHREYEISSGELLGTGVALKFIVER